MQDWLAQEQLSVAGMLAHVREMERRFLSELDRLDAAITSHDLLVPEESRRGRFLTFRTNAAADITARLAANNIIVDHRADRLRIGFGIYHEPADVVRLAQALASP